MKGNKVFNWKGEQVVAWDEKDARRIVREEFGVKRVDLLRRAKGPFVLADCDEEPLEVSESEFAERVETYGGGVVKQR
jgi:hypothetical protein